MTTPPKFKIGDRVRKTKGSSWTGRVVGTYSTELTSEGYAVESDTEKGSVQIYPAAALDWAPIPVPARIDQQLLHKINSVMGIEIPAMHGDNLAVSLCTYFENPEQEPDGERGWTPDAEAAVKDIQKKLLDHFAPAVLEAAKTAIALESLQANLEWLIRNSAFDSGAQTLSDAFGLITDESGEEVDWMMVCKALHQKLADTAHEGVRP